MKKILFACALMSGVNGYATLNCIESLNSRVENLEYPEPVKKGLFQKDPPKKERPREVNQLTFFGEFLYWQTGITGDVFCLSHNVISAPEFGMGAALDTDQKANTVGFEYKPGFRVWADYEMPFDEWSLDLVWTVLSAKASNSVTKSSSLDVHTVWDTTNAMVPDYASGEMHENFQVVDLNFGKTFMWSRPFTFHFYTGLKGALVHEKFDVFYNGTFASIPATESITLKNYFKGIGLNNGIRATWNLCRSFNFYARGEAALLWGGFHETLGEIICVAGDINNSYDVQASNPLRSVKTNLNAEAGFNWSFNIRCKFLLSLFAGYEFNYWPNQIVWNRYLTNDQSLTGGVAYVLQELGDVGFQGLNVGASISF